ncbi:ABC transporter substrate-binding protein [Micromonospora aurantiaca]|nr:ABC transporter substrate-binding protein [Micromonospora aurantiaca]
MKRSITAAGAALAMILGGCGASPTDQENGRTGGRGGTLIVLASADFANLDPAQNWTMRDVLFGGRTLYRTLTAYAAAPGSEGTKVRPDLAEELGVPSGGNRTWTYKLRSGVKFEDGSVVTSKDVKYGIERIFAAELQEGPGYLRDLLVGGEKYAGPYKDPRGLPSILTPDDRTIVFELRKPTADLDYILALPTSAPVRKEKDTGVKYNSAIFSTGPYKIERYDRGKELVLVRNSHWDPSTDSIRKALPDRIEVKQGLSSATIEQRLIADQGRDQRAVAWAGISAASMPRVLSDPKVKDRYVAEPSICTRMLTFNTAKPPFDNLMARQAVAYGISREAYRTAHGGEGVGDFATSFMPPSLTAGQKNEAFQAPPEGDVTKARRLLADAGKPEGLEITLTTTSTDTGRAEAEAVQSSLARIGVRVKINSVDASVFYSTTGTPATADELVFDGWCADWPNGASFIPQKFDGRNIQPKGNRVISQLNDPSVNKRVDEILALTDANSAQKAWGELDTQIIQLMPAVPLVWDKMPLLHGSKVTGVFGHPIWQGEIDYAAVSVA